MGDPIALQLWTLAIYGSTMILSKCIVVPAAFDVSTYLISRTLSMLALTENNRGMRLKSRGTCRRLVC